MDAFFERDDHFVCAAFDAIDNRVIWSSFAAPSGGPATAMRRTIWRRTFSIRDR